MMLAVEGAAVSKEFVLISIRRICSGVSPLRSSPYVFLASASYMHIHCAKLRRSEGFLPSFSLQWKRKGKKQWLLSNKTVQAGGKNRQGCKFPSIGLPRRAHFVAGTVGASRSQGQLQGVWRISVLSKTVPDPRRGLIDI